MSKVSGNVAAGLGAAWKITTTFVRLAISLRRQQRQHLLAERSSS